MREILFRGKRIDNGEWVEGSLVSFRDKEKAILPSKSCVFFSHRKNVMCCEECIEVDPSTVGQYTELNDKNGKRIFEGDLIKPFDDEIDKIVVEFHHGDFLLCVYGERGYMGENGWIEEGNYGVLECEPLSSCDDDIETIGNIHDNPELLKGGDGWWLNGSD